MSDEIGEEEWGELTRDGQLPIKLKKSKILLGRAKDCDIKVDSRLVSSHHCYLERNDLGIVVLCDTSTNGTVVNKSMHLKKGKTHQLSSGDEISLVYTKDEPETNISFVYEEMKCSTLDDSADTLEYSLDAQKELGTYSAETLPLEDDEEPDCKKQKCEEGKITENPHVHSSQEAGLSTINVCETKKAGKWESEKTQKPVEALDMMEETLLCSICQEIFHDCISLQPCMHCFCAGCYSPWMKKSDACPQCRHKVIRISKNHIINNLVEAFVKKHPDKKRPDSVTKELDNKNEIPHDTLYPQNIPPGEFDYESDESRFSGSVSDSSEDGSFNYGNLLGLPRIPGLYHSSSSSTPLALVKCRQCPSYNGRYNVQTNDNLVDASTSAAGGSTSTATTPCRFTCTPHTIHAYCQCCAQPMPDRRHEAHGNPDIAPQQCSSCYGLFCHMYWGCRKDGCSGCLNTFQNMNFGDKCLTSLISENNFESNILMDYLKSQNLSWKDLLQMCIERLESRVYTCNPTVTATTVLCYRCALRSFRQLAYLYRKDIPNENLPAEVGLRPNCYWGRNCRTQKTRPHHAANFNHICEQTKFS